MSEKIVVGKDKWTPSPDTPGWLVERRHPAVLNPMKVIPSPDRCFYCGAHLVTCGTSLHGRPTPDNLKTYDHRIPRIKGGQRGKNLIISCYRCNVDKGALAMEEYRLVLAYRAGKIGEADQLYKFWGEEK